MPSDYFKKQIKKMSSEEIQGMLEELEKARAERKEIKEEVKETEENLQEIKEKMHETGESVQEIKEEMQENVHEITEHVEEIKEEVIETGKELDEIKEVLRYLGKAQKNALNMVYKSIVPEEFTFKDLAQQTVGAMALSAPLSVTQEVWELARLMDPPRAIMIAFITITFDVLLFYYTKFREVKNEKILGIMPKRILSLIIVSYSIAALMLLVFGVIGLQVTDAEWQWKLVIFIGLFANIGAGAADLLK